MLALLQVGCQVKVKVDALLVEDTTKPDGTKAKRRQKTFTTSQIVAATGARMFSVLFENGGMEDKRSNTLAYVLADLHFAAHPASIPLQQSEVLIPNYPST